MALGSLTNGDTRSFHYITKIQSLESTAVTVSSQLVDASRGFSIVGVRGTIESIDRRVSNVPVNESRL